MSTCSQQGHVLHRGAACFACGYFIPDPDLVPRLRQTALWLGLVGVYLHLAMALDLASEGLSYTDDYFRDKWSLDENAVALGLPPDRIPPKERP